MCVRKTGGERRDGVEKGGLASTTGATERSHMWRRIVESSLCHHQLPGMLPVHHASEHTTGTLLWASQPAGHPLHNSFKTRCLFAELKIHFTQQWLHTRKWWPLVWRLYVSLLKSSLLRKWSVQNSSNCSSAGQQPDIWVQISCSVGISITVPAITLRDIYSALKC